MSSGRRPATDFDRARTNESPMSIDSWFVYAAGVPVVAPEGANQAGQVIELVISLH